MYHRKALDGRGDGALAAKPIRAGSCVLKCDPCVAVPLDMAITCAYCFSPGARRCGLCKVFHYCSRTCQLADWAVHSTECKYMAQYLNDNPLTPTLLMAVRLLRLPTSLDAVAHLLSHLDQHLPSQREDYHTMSTVVISVLARMNLKTPLPSIEDVMKLFGQFNCNAFTVCTLEQVPVGIGMYPEAALLNHSCAPNCIITFHQRQLQIRALRDIAPGEELTVSYIELMSDRESRQEELWSSYFFTCQCARCNSPEHPDLTRLLVEDHEAIEKQISNLNVQADSYESKQNSRRAVDSRVRALKLAKTIYNPRHVCLTLAAETLANLITSSEHSAHQTPEDIEIAQEAYTNVLANQSWLYSEFQMEAFRGLCTYKLGRLCFQVGDFNAALIYVREACQFLSITHGEDCQLVHGAIEFLHEIEREMQCK